MGNPDSGATSVSLRSLGEDPYEAGWGAGFMGAGVGRVA